MKRFFIFGAAIILAACGTTTKYEMTPDLCPTAVPPNLPNPPSAVTSQPVNENFLEQLLEYFNAEDYNDYSS